MFAVESYAAVRRFVFVEGNSRREAARVFGLSRETVAKMCRFALPPGYTRTKPVEKPKLGPLLPVIDAILEVDRAAPVKQRHTAKGNDKGKVEGLVKHARMNFMVPVPEAASFDELNVRFVERCHARQAERAGRHGETIGERLVADSAAGGMNGTADAMPTGTTGTTSGTPQVLLAHHLKQLKLPTVLREYDKVARECARDGVDHPRYLLRLIELELIDRERRTIERRIRAARFPAVKSFDTFEFAAIPSLNKMLVLELARCEYILRRENVIALGNSGTGKTHVALALGLAACQKGFTVAFTTAAALVSQLLEARDERRLLKLQRDLAAVKLLIIDELGYVPLSPTGAELLFEVFSQRYERGSTIVTSNLPFEDWTQVLGSERLTGALLDRLTHHVSILTMDGDSYRLKQSAGRRRSARAEQNQATEIVDPETGEITTA